MQTHSDRDATIGEARELAEQKQEFMGTLEKRARRMMAAGESHITAGKPGEKPLAEHMAVNEMFVSQLADDEQGVLRISIGGGILHVRGQGNYCVFRGDRVKCRFLLQMAIAALDELGA